MSGARRLIVILAIALCGPTAFAHTKIFGKVLLVNGTKPGEGVPKARVIVRAADGTVLRSGLTRDDGTYEVPIDEPRRAAILQVEKVQYERYPHSQKVTDPSREQPRVPLTQATRESANAASYNKRLASILGESETAVAPSERFAYFSSVAALPQSERKQILRFIEASGSATTAAEFRSAIRTSESIAKFEQEIGGLGPNVKVASDPLTPKGFVLFGKVNSLEDGKHIDRILNQYAARNDLRIKNELQFPR